MCLILHRCYFPWLQLFLQDSMRTKAGGSSSSNSPSNLAGYEGVYQVTIYSCSRSLRVLFIWNEDHIKTIWMMLFAAQSAVINCYILSYKYKSFPLFAIGITSPVVLMRKEGSDILHKKLETCVNR